MSLLWMIHRIAASKRQRALVESSAVRVPLRAEPEHAWKLLSLVNDWIRHSDAKAGVTLAFAGALGAMLFNLTRDASLRSAGFDLVVIVGCLLLLSTVWFCGCTLTPRVKDRDGDSDLINRLFFASIAKHFGRDRVRYVEVLSTLTSDPDELVKDLADQIHANARIATLKTRYAGWAVRSALGAGASVGALALIVGVSSL